MKTSNHIALGIFLILVILIGLMLSPSSKTNQPVVVANEADLATQKAREAVRAIVEKEEKKTVREKLCTGKCTPREERIVAKNWSWEVSAAIWEKRVIIGMTMEQAEFGWGKPQRINETIGLRGVQHQWVYGIGNYLYFRDGILTNIQTSR